MTQRQPGARQRRLGKRTLRDSRQAGARALALERLGYDIVSLNIGNPYAFGFRTPETMRLAMIENLRHSEGYVHQKGIFPGARSGGDAAAGARRARRHGRRGVHRQRRERTHRSHAARAAQCRRRGAGAESRLSVVDRGRQFEYRPRGALSLPPGARFMPDPEEIEALITRRTRAHRHRQSEQSHRRGVSARDAGGDRANRREASAGGAVATRSTTRFFTTARNSCPWPPSCTTRCAAR